MTFPTAPSPAYILEERLLRRNLRLITDISRRSGAEFILAFKAFALWKTFSIFREYIAHTTASSPYEARLALEEFGSRAHTYTPAYEADTFDEMLRCSSVITFNSLTQYAQFYPRIREWNATHGSDEQVDCGLRVNPEYSEIETALYDPCAPKRRGVHSCFQGLRTLENFPHLSRVHRPYHGVLSLRSALGVRRVRQSGAHLHSGLRSGHLR